MNILLTGLAAIIIFAVLIFVHEFGHFISAKIAKIKVHEFALGMGPKLFGFTKGETLYSVRLFPIGGYCKLEGEDGASDDERALVNKPPYVRLIVLVAGAAMNILLGFALLNVVVGSQDAVVTTQIAEVKTDSPAALAGLLPGDKIIEVASNNTPVSTSLHWELAEIDGSEKIFTIKRNNEKFKVGISPLFDSGKYMFGMSFEVKDNSFLMTLKESFHLTVFYSKVIVESLFDLIRGNIGIDQMSGPIGIVSEIGSAVESVAQTGAQGILDLLFLTILLTVNLGVFNLLPIPALDGGRILFVLVEIIRRKPLPPEKEGLVHMIGLGALLLLSIFIAFKDILKLF